MELGDLIRGIEGLRLVSGSTEGVRVGDITEDSRTVLPGSLFVARAGIVSDGRAYIPRAIELGAVAILTDAEGADSAGSQAAVLVCDDPAWACAQLAERYYGQPSSAIRLAGITGTNGKTTTAHLAHAILNGAGIRSGLIGTVEIDDGIELAPSEMTTMPAIELSRTFAVMQEQLCGAAVMEVSSHALDQRRSAALDFDVAVFTNLTPEHLDYHGTLERYADAKAILFESVSSAGTAIVNADDEHHVRMLANCDAEVIRCSALGRADADFEVREIEATISGAVYELAGAWGSVECRVPLIGAHNGMNLLQACAIAWAMGVDLPGLREGLKRVTAPPGRLEFVSSAGSPVTVIVDYAHTDDALERALSSIKPLTAGELSVVFGAGGDRDRGKRPRMGEVVARYADRVIVTSDNPRHEDPSDIIGDILRGIPRDRAAAVSVHPDREVAIREAVQGAQLGGVVLIAGKGHETTQSLPDGRGGVRTIDFDDRKIARAAIAEQVVSQDQSE